MNKNSFVVISRKFLFIILCIVVGMIGLDYEVNRYHKKRIEKHKFFLQKLKETNSSQEEIENILGKPWEVVNSKKAIEVYGHFFSKNELIQKSSRYYNSTIMVYLKGDIVYFIYLNNKGRVVDFLVGRN